LPPEVAALVDHGLHHPGEQVANLVDGGVEYRVRLSHLEEIARWVVGFGGRAWAVEPAELVDRVRELAEDAAAGHRAAASPRRRRR
jgi:predicted DNA-binding transcriptional regulator YafY